MLEHRAALVYSRVCIALHMHAKEQLTGTVSVVQIVVTRCTFGARCWYIAPETIGTTF